MSDSSLAVPVDKTFRFFTKSQGTEYAKIRPGYHSDLYKNIIEHHTSTGGKLDTVLDIGCGRATCELASHFTHAVGLDPSEGMIKNARDLAPNSSTTESIRFEISTAEELGSHLSPPINNCSIDLITAATAAHWFDMSRFWPRAAEVLKPGGTVVVWCTGEPKMHPSMPNAAAIQAATEEIRERELTPFIELGNRLARGLYIDLLMPWALSLPVAAFDEATFFRKEWGPENSEEFFVGGATTADLDTVEKLMSTMSPVQRWREAHPDAVGTNRDYVKMQRSAIERLLHEAGVEKGKEIVKGNVTGVLLMVKKKME
ncbi:methyltransferase [Hyphodiscus hymeniophilus]|uniref:Methyltransferase n=1 Tax=Hyphodiscus hymeniophilus TaxID=353542 RepID=A0A9P7AUB8_9HELO|nr:methyltransferase [Hyphodiscus hymeniophilus]